MKGYYEKLICCGENIYELKRYEKLNVLSGGKRECTGESENKEKNYAYTTQQRRDSIRRLACMNFDSGSRFVTLTFNDQQQHNIRDVKECRLYFKRFILRLKYRYPGLRYLAVIEFQDRHERGAIHYHMLCNLPYFDSKELSEIWGGGFINIRRIDHVDNVGAYLVKYMKKGQEDPRLMGQQAYLYSRNLDKPVELCTWREETAAEWQRVHDMLEKETPSYAATYESAECGRIEYRQFNFNRRIQQIGIKVNDSDSK